MVAVSRLMRPSRGLQSDHIPCSSSLNYSFCGRPPPTFFWGAPGINCRHRKRMDVPHLGTAPTIGTSTTSPHSPSKSMEGVGNLSLPSSLASGTEATSVFVRLLGLLSRLKYSTRFCWTDWKLRAEMLIERGIIGCQSFTFTAVAGSLIGSVLCFVEGFIIVVKAYIYYFRTLSQNAAQSGIIQLLIEAIDMFLVGSALLTLGMGLYVMLTSSDEINQGKGRPALGGGSNIKNVPMSITEAKSKLGHVVVMILQAEILDKFKNVPLSSGLDLACFAGAVFISSASVLLLSRLAMRRSKITCGTMKQSVLDDQY